MGRYFAQFHNVLYPHISIRNGKKIPDIYNEVFSWTIPANEQITDRPDGNAVYYSGPQVTRWTTGAEELPLSILMQAVNNPDMAVETYAAIFYNLLYNQLNLSGQSIEMLDSDMKLFLSAFPISFFDVDDEPEKENSYYPASHALVTALIYDRVLRDGRSGKNRLIDAQSYKLLSDTFSMCKKNNIKFSSPFILEILFRGKYSILRFALELVADGLGRKWNEKVQDYIKNAMQKPFIDENLGEHEVIFLTKISAVKENYIFGYTNEICEAHLSDICLVFPFCRNSGTITELWADITDHEVNQDLWEEIILYSRWYLSKSNSPSTVTITEEDRKSIIQSLQME